MPTKRSASSRVDAAAELQRVLPAPRRGCRARRGSTRAAPPRARAASPAPRSRRATLTPSGSGSPVSSSHHSPRSSDLLQPSAAVGQLALVDEQPRVGAAGLHLVDDLVERHLAVAEARRGTAAGRGTPSSARPGIDDLDVAQLVEVERLARDDDRPVARAHRWRRAGAARSASCDERVRARARSPSPRAAPRAPTRSASGCRGGRARTRSRRGSTVPAGERPEHERVVGIGAVTEADLHEAPEATRASAA